MHMRIWRGEWWCCEVCSRTWTGSPFMTHHEDYYESFEAVLYTLGFDWRAMECPPRMGGDVTILDHMFTFSLFRFPYLLEARRQQWVTQPFS